MYMFAAAALLLVTGGAFGTPWLASLITGGSQASANLEEVGVVCPSTLAGLVLTSQQGGDFSTEGGLSILDCRYSLPGEQASAMQVTLKWSETEPVANMLRDCGKPPMVNPGVFSSDGSYYGVIGLSRADYSGQRRYANLMQDLASDLTKAAAAIAYPCPGFEELPRTGQSGSGSEPDGSVSLAPLSDPLSDATSTAVATQTGGATPTVGGGTAVSGTGGGQLDGGQGPSSGTTGGQAGGDGCVVSGRVTDNRGLPVAGIHMQLLDSGGSFFADTATLQDGRFQFPARLDGSGAVVLIPEDFGRTPGRFRIFHRQASAALGHELSAADVAAESCGVNFDIWDLDSEFTAIDSMLEHWPAIIELYQNFSRAADLAEMVGAPLDYGLPLPVYAWCDSAELFCDPTGTAEFAFYAGSTPGRDVEQPYIALSFPTSAAGYKGTPDNREYHEYGHAVMADVLGNSVPFASGDTNHGGYYRNPGTTDSWIEGFAEFYSMMVAKHIDGESNPERYRIGAEYDLEEDRLPWEAVGWWEEFTIAGLLLDFEDGDADYAAPGSDVSIESVAPLSAETGNFAIGRVRNSGDRVNRSPEVTVDLLDDGDNVVFTQVTAVKPTVLGPGQTGVFYVAAPDGVSFSKVNAATGRPTGEDDDPIDVDLSDLLRAVTADWGAGESPVTNVKQLRDALSAAFAGQDLDGDGSTLDSQADIDTLFIRHGFFDDLNGSKAYEFDQDGTIGGSAHPETVVSRTRFPELLPRSSAEAFEAALVTIQTGGVAADLLVQVEVPSEGARQSYAYWTDSASAPVELAVPPGDSGGAVTVIAAADGHNPAVAYRTSASEFEQKVESGEITDTPAQSSISLEPGDPFAVLSAPGGPPGDSDSAGGPPWMMVAPVALAGLILVGGVILMRRSTRQINGNQR